MSINSGNAIGIIISVVIELIVVYLIYVYIGDPLLTLAVACVPCIGGFHAVYNYYIAFKTNVKPERANI